MNNARPFRSWFGRLLGRDRRIAIRRPAPGLVAYFWTGGDPVAYAIRDVSAAGMYLLTDQRWYLGTSLKMTLQTVGRLNGDPACSISVRAKVIRSCADGVAVEFSVSAKNSPRNGKVAFGLPADKNTLARFIQHYHLPAGSGIEE